MWILINTADYFKVKIELVNRDIEYINPQLNLIAIRDTERNRRIAVFLALRDGCAIEDSVGLDRILCNYATLHPKRIIKMP